MKDHITTLLTIIFVLFISLLCHSAYCQQNIDIHDYQIVTDVPRVEVDSWLKTNMQKHGADPKHGRYRFIIGFSTGHFNTDPLNAIAMRRLAFSLLNNTFTSGDQVQTVAWEMNVWNCSQPITLSNNPASRQEFVNNVPYSPMAGSQGGHDIEKALYDILRSQLNAVNASHTVILLLTNSDESQSPTGSSMRLFGANNPLLLHEIKLDNYYYPPERKIFQMKTGKENIVVYAIALLPNKLVPFPNTAQLSRYPTFSLSTWRPVGDKPGTNDVIPNPTLKNASATHAPVRIAHSHHTNMWLLIIFIPLILIILGILYWILTHIKHPKGNQPPIGKPLPGQINYTLGMDDKKILHQLTRESKWKLIQKSDGNKTEYVINDVHINNESKEKDEKEEHENNSELAKLSFDKANSKRRYMLNVEACFGFYFNDIHPSAPPEKYNRRSLKIEPDESMFCTITDDNNKSIIRMELNYQKDTSTGK